MIRIERHMTRDAVAVDQQKDFAVLDYGALPPREHDLAHVQGDARVKILLGVERFVAGVADEIVGHPKAISIFSYRRVKPHEPSKQSRSQDAEPSRIVANVSHGQLSLLLLI